MLCILFCWICHTLIFDCESKFSAIGCELNASRMRRVDPRANQQWLQMPKCLGSIEMLIAAEANQELQWQVIRPVASSSWKEGGIRVSFLSARIADRCINGWLSFQDCCIGLSSQSFVSSFGYIESKLISRTSHVV